MWNTRCVGGKVRAFVAANWQLRLGRSILLSKFYRMACSKGLVIEWPPRKGKGRGLLASCDIQPGFFKLKSPLVRTYARVEQWFSSESLVKEFAKQGNMELYCKWPRCAVYKKWLLLCSVHCLAFLVLFQRIGDASTWIIGFEPSKHWCKSYIWRTHCFTEHIRLCE